MGLSQGQKVSDRRAKEVLEGLKGKGVVKTLRSPTEILRQTQKRLFEENHKNDGSKITMAEMREKMEADKKHKEEVEQRIAGFRGERAREEAESSAGRRKEVTSISQLKKTETSAGKKAEKFGPETTTSVFHGKKSDTKPAEENKPQVIDLQID
jgi:hypothetical protein